MLFRVLTIWLFLAFSFIGHSQQITNSGTEFWFAFPEMFDNTRAVYWVNITANDSTGGTVSIPGISWSQTFSIKAGEVARVNIPAAHATNMGSNMKFNKAIKISANDPVVAFAVTYHAFRHEASLILPNNAVGKRYRVMSYKSEIKSGQLHESEFCIVSTGDTVIVDITPKGNIASGANVNTTYTDTIYPNEIYQAQARSAWDDLTGTLIEGKNNKNFAVYSGNVWSTVVCSPNSDPLMEGLFPTNTWGKDYFVIPTPRVNKDYVRIVADKDTTRIYRDGTLRATLMAGQFYADTITTIRHYTADKPVSLAQFLVTGQNWCTQHVNTDPSMIMCNATEQMFLDSITFFAVDTSAIDSHYVHIITRTADTGTMYLDSVQLSKWTPFTQNTAVSYRTVNVTPGYHRLESTGCGFIAYSMGIGRAVSYGYATGASLVDLENSITYTNFVTGSDTICQADTVSFKSIIRGKPTSFKWYFGDGDSSTLQNPFHSYDSVGIYQIKAIVVYPCITDTLIDTLVVPPAPIINLGPDTILCNKDTLKFTVNTAVFRAKWSNGSTDSFLVIDQPGTYWAHVYNYCGSGYDTVKIDSLYPDTVDLGPDTILCKGDTIHWDITAVWGSTYKWWDSSTAATNWIDTAGVYWAEVQNRCGVMRDNIRVLWEEHPVIDLGPDTVLCDGQRIQLIGFFSRSRYKWNDGIVSPLRWITAPGGDYWMNAENLCGSYTDSISVDFDFPINPYLGQDSVVCIRDTILLDPQTDNGICLWQNGSTDTVMQVYKAGTYWIVAENACGQFSDTVIFSEEYIPRVTLPNDTLICDGTQLALNAHFSGASYRWNTGETTASKTVTRKGTYVVTIQNICGTASDDITVLYDFPMNIYLGRDTMICDKQGFDIVLNYPNNPSYEWSNGQVGNRIRVQRQGRYTVFVRNRCGVYSGSVYVNAMYTPEPDLGPDTILCQGDIYTFRSRIPVDKRLGVIYEWNNGRTDRDISVRQAGTYSVYAYNVCGSGRDTASVSFNEIPQVSIEDTMVCIGDEIRYDFSQNWGYEYNWNNDWDSPFFVVTEPGEYSVSVRDSIGCGSTDYFEVDKCPIPLWVPKAFSPNNDQVNDEFKAVKDGIYYYHIQIIDRWGQKVFETNDINNGWNGGLNNQIDQPCAIGSYAWRITFKESENHQIQSVTGEVVLYR